MHDVEAVNSASARPLYKARVKVFPKRVKGFFRTLKWRIMVLTLAVYYITPWLRWDRGPSAPDQAVLIDLAHRRFYFFFIEIWPQEFYYVAGLLIMAGVGLFLITSTVGRAWCGYSCPQTVWTDLFVVIERWIDGDRNARIRLDKAAWTFQKVRKRVIKHALWLLIGVLTGGAWIFYFADAPTLLRDFVTLNAAPVAYSTVAILTATTYLLAGFMREQVCTYMCPWPRIQAAMLDENSLTVTYNEFRGEPRTRGKKKAAAEGGPVGDCVDCNACVAVCPVGIDIRHGQQLECITCALCIDACNDVMGKLGRKSNLITYATLIDMDRMAAGREVHPSWRTFIRPRTMIYSGFFAAAGIALLMVLSTRSRLEVNVLHDRNPIFTQLSSGSIRNGYKVKILNMKQGSRSFRLSLRGLPGATMTMAGSDLPPTRGFDIVVKSDKLRKVKIYVTADPSSLIAQSTPFEFSVSDLSGTETAIYAAAFKSPK